MNKLQQDITQFALLQGAVDIGFTKLDEKFKGFEYAISVVVKLSDFIVDEITDMPTHQYFHHYRTVNAFIDNLTLKIGFMLEGEGYKYLPVASSQSINTDGNDYQALYSHKKIAYRAGLGEIGKNSLFLHKDYGPRVRLGTIFTNCEFDTTVVTSSKGCLNCDLCVKACPSGAITGNLWYPGIERKEVFDPKACSDHMKAKYKMIGRGVVCGICMRVCPFGEKNKDK
ncbi:MAG: epoxyqueuosine reductase [Oscillospiraceae bacterium]|nr:epoxyqueuosine reductase [Oscillospiraceae bacterium]